MSRRAAPVGAARHRPAPCVGARVPAFPRLATLSSERILLAWRDGTTVRAAAVLGDRLGRAHTVATRVGTLALAQLRSTAVLAWLDSYAGRRARVLRSVQLQSAGAPVGRPADRQPRGLRCDPRDRQQRAARDRRVAAPRRPGAGVHAPGRAVHASRPAGEPGASSRSTRRRSTWPTTASAALTMRVSAFGIPSFGIVAANSQSGGVWTRVAPLGVGSPMNGSPHAVALGGRRSLVIWADAARRRRDCRRLRRPRRSRAMPTGAISGQQVLSTPLRPHRRRRRWRSPMRARADVDRLRRAERRSGGRRAHGLRSYPGGRCRRSPPRRLPTACRCTASPSRGRARRRSSSPSTPAPAPSGPRRTAWPTSSSTSSSRAARSTTTTARSTRRPSAWAARSTPTPRTTSSPSTSPCAPRRRMEAIDLLTDFVGRPKIDADELDRERGVVIQEIQRYKDQPSAVAEELIDRPRSATTRSGRTVLGPRGAPAHVHPRRDRRVPRAPLGGRARRRVHRRQRRPRAGQRRGRRALRALPRRCASPRPTSPRRRFEPQALVEQRDSNQSHLRMIYRPEVDVDRPRGSAPR